MYLDMMDAQVASSDLMKAFRALPPLDRDLVIDLYMNEVTIEDAAAGMECKPDVLRNRMAKIRKFLAGVPEISGLLA